MYLCFRVQVEGEQKKLVGGLGAIEKMLFIIREKLKAGVSIVFDVNQSM